MTKPLKLKDMPGEAAVVVQCITAAAQAWGVSAVDILGRSREADVAKARRLAMSLSRSITKLSHSEIALYFGKTHGAVLNACRQMAGRLKAGGSREAFHFLEIRQTLATEPVNPPPMPEAAALF